MFTIEANGSIKTDMYALARHYGRSGIQQMVNDMAAAGASEKAVRSLAKMVYAVAR